MSLPAVGSASNQTGATDSVAAAVLAWLRATEDGQAELRQASAGIHEPHVRPDHHLVFRGPVLRAAWREPVTAYAAGSSPAEAALEARRQNWCAERGVPSPEVLALVPDPMNIDGDCLVLTTGSRGVSMLRIMETQPWRTLNLTDELATTQAHLHALDTADWPERDECTESLLDQRLRELAEAVDRISDGCFDRALNAVVRHRTLLEQGPTVVCHGDLHPLTAMVTDKKLILRQWSLAGLGDPHGDVARTLLFFPIAAATVGRPAERLLLRAVSPIFRHRYLWAYQRHRPLDVGRLRLWESIHLLLAWSTTESQARTHGSPVDVASAERVSLWVRHRLETDRDEA